MTMELDTILCGDSLNVLKALPESVKTGLHLDGIVAAAETYLPLFSIGLGWVLPAAVGLVIGLILYRKKQTA